MVAGRHGLGLNVGALGARAVLASSGTGAAPPPTTTSLSLSCSNENTEYRERHPGRGYPGVSEGEIVEPHVASTFKVTGEWALPTKRVDFVNTFKRYSISHLGPALNTSMMLLITLQYTSLGMDWCDNLDAISAPLWRHLGADLGTLSTRSRRNPGAGTCRAASRCGSSRPRGFSGRRSTTRSPLRSRSSCATSSRGRTGSARPATNHLLIDY